LENITVDLSWEAREAKFTQFESQFDRIYKNEEEGIEHISATELEVAIMKEFGDVEIDTLLQREKNLLDLEVNNSAGSTPNFDSEIKHEQPNFTQDVPAFPFSSGPREYQKEAYQNWVANDKKGIFAMATGTGKTLTALNCLLEEYLETGQYRALILVPYKILVDQWEREVKAFRFKNIIKVSSENLDWRSELDRLIENDKLEVPWKRIIICTYASFGGQDFLTRLSKLDSSKLLLIADEVHNLGAGRAQLGLKHLKIPKRIGLSATPKRVYDETGTVAIESFFNDKEPYTYSFSMERAIAEGILCKYAYYPFIVTLTETEMILYKEISDDLATIYHQLDTRPELKTRFEMLLLERKRIIHKAENKLSTFREIIQSLKSNDQLKYTLVYAPEGNYSEESGVFDSFPMSNDDDTRVINLYSKVVREVSPTTTTDQYTSSSDGREFTLKCFMEGQIDVLLSMKCLDEGVDIPRTERAIFCSSTANPRQFIQRRGRILRQHPDKHFATIYDLVVVPHISDTSPSFEIEQKTCE
jgi:superfamily II DNA or RNA helicase